MSSTTERSISPWIIPKPSLVARMISAILPSTSEAKAPPISSTILRTVRSTIAVTAATISGP